MKLLDLFCKAGGCGMGYARAGFEVVGVDIESQAHYPFTFIQADALTFPFNGFDVLHASPPCQAYSIATYAHRAHGKVYPDLLGSIRERFLQAGKPWIIENVPGAPMHSGMLLCGSMFGLRVRRHRYFETSHLLFAPGSCQHTQDFVTIFGNHVTRARKNPFYRGKRGIRSKLTTEFPLEVGLQAMGIDWMNAQELSQAIPPVYTEWIGKQLLSYLTP